MYVYNMRIKCITAKFQNRRRGLGVAVESPRGSLWLTILSKIERRIGRFRLHLSRNTLQSLNLHVHNPIINVFLTATHQWCVNMFLLRTFSLMLQTKSTNSHLCKISEWFRRVRGTTREACVQRVHTGSDIGNLSR
jgi:hypothetical protein